MNVILNVYDWVAIGLYLAVVIGIGCWAGLRQRRSKSGDQGREYFLAGGHLNWVVIGLALFSTNISTVHLVGLAEEGYKNGLACGNFEWMAPFTLIILSFFFAPFYIRTRVATLPDFLEMRFSRGCRNWLAVISMLAAIVVHISFALFAGATVLHGLFDVPMMTSLIGLGVLIAFYTSVGGLMAVVAAESVQTIVLLVGAVCLTGFGLHEVGGWSGMAAHVDPVKLTVMRPAGDASNMPWYAILLGYPIIGIWYWCTDQTIVQRVLGAKDENHARVGPLFAGFLKILPVFLLVLPGLICAALVHQGKLPELKDTKDAFTVMVANLLPTGLKGVMAAALMAAIMGAVSGAMNSIATLFCYDLYKQLKPDVSDKKLVLIGRVVTWVGMILAIAWASQLGKFASVFQGIQTVICYVAPSLTVVFLAGVFWKRATARAAFATLASGFGLGVTVFFLDFFKATTGWNVNFMMASFYLACVCGVILVVVSLAWPKPLTDKQAALVWGNPMDALRAPGWPGLGNYKVLAALLVVTMVVLYSIFG
jgi:SSS family solute:Na+ symporter